MKLLIISDTHDNLAVIDRLGRVVSDFKPDLMIHLGDYISAFTLRKLLSLGIRLVGVFGNNDGDKILLLTTLSNLGEVHEQPFELKLGDGLSMLLIHGFGDRNTTEVMVKSLAMSGRYDVILYGHTHQVRVEAVNNVILLNPGALSGYLTDKSTAAVFDVGKMKIKLIDVTSGEVSEYDF